MVTDASVHDSVVVKSFLHGEEQVVCGDKRYVNDAKRDEAQAKDID